MAKSAKTAKNKSSGKSEVETYKHKEAKRKNIPTAENQKLIADDDKAIKKLRWPRNPDLDPQLVWRGKDVEPDPLEVDAPPIYIQEKIKPQAIIEDLRRQTKERTKDAAPQFDFFHDFNGLPEGWKEDATASYYHDEGNWSNRMILGDSLLVMASLAEREGLRGKVQCVYIDPPYGIRFSSNWQPSTKNTNVKESNRDSITREPEVIRAFRDTWKDGVNTYLHYLRDRLTAARDLMADSGSIFVQIGDENVHRVRALLDEVFGDRQFLAEIGFRTTTGKGSSFIDSTFDYLLWYGKDREKTKFRTPYLKRDFRSDVNFRALMLSDGTTKALDEDYLLNTKELPEGARVFRINPITSQTPSESTTFSYNYAGHDFAPSKGGVENQYTRNDKARSGRETFVFRTNFGFSQII